MKEKSKQCDVKNLMREEDVLELLVLFFPLHLFPEFVHLLE